MEIKHFGIFIGSFLLFECVTSSSIMSGLARFGFEPLKHDICDRNSSDPRTCYVSVSANVSCFTAQVYPERCKTHVDNFTHSTNDDVTGPRNWTNLVAYYHRHDGVRHRPGTVGSCLDISPSNCTEYRCIKTCCAGWEMDSSGQCSVATSSLCKNGGTYDRRMKKCMCTQGYSGQHCEIALCHRGCLNGGMCTPTTAGNNACLCPPHASGSHCQYLQCPQRCENGGHCILDGTLPACKCPPGFYGKTCSHSYQGDSYCPQPNTTLCTDLYCSDGCSTDGECPKDQVCCTDGCCMKCVRPRSRGCWHDGILYERLSMFRKDNCTTCFCKMNGTSRCYTDPVSYDNDYCCFFDCKVNDTGHLKGNEGLGRPTINCSDEIKDVAVNSQRNLAYMNNLNIRAWDSNGFDLKVYYTPSYALHDRSPISHRNIELISASAADSTGHIVKCHQKVRIVDRTPPRFLFCPSDISAIEHQIVSWIKPRADDNVGLLSIYSNVKPFTSFHQEYSMVVYTATDYDGNKAFCQFFVHVTKGDTIPPYFSYCPTAVYGNEGKPLYWQEPRASDNEGIRSLVSTHNSDSFFSPGVTKVVYTATDYANNKAYCTFHVYIAPKETDVPDYEEPSKHYMSDAVKVTIGSVCILIVILIFVTITVVIFRRYRSKPSNTTRENRRPELPTICHIGGMVEGLNDSFVPTLKPPPYSPATDPPAYEEIFTISNTDNNSGSLDLPVTPPEYDTIEQNIHDSI